MGTWKSALILAASLLLGAQFATPARADMQCANETVREFDERGGADPFPLNCPLPFPWTSIEGNWELKGAGVYTAYSFEMQNSCEGRKILRIRQFNVITGEVLAEGIGVEEANTKKVRAIMKGKTGSYMLYVGRYLRKDVNPPVPANVLRVVPIENPEAGKAWEILQIDFNIRVGDKSRQASALTCVNDPDSL